MSEEKISPQRFRKNRVVKENHLDFLYNLHLHGVDIGFEDLQLLREAGYLKEKEIPKQEAINEEVNKYALQNVSTASLEADSKIDIRHEEEDDGSLIVIRTDAELEKRRQEGGHVFFGRKTPITKEEWLPASITEHSPEFVTWITSITMLGFSKRKQYHKLTLYCQQAYSWLAEGKSVSDFDDEQLQEDYMLEEVRRCNENTLYFANKYGYYKEGNVGGGRVKYVASPAHEIIMYLDDCGYSTIAAKGRQMAFTTTKQLCNLKAVIFKKNFFIKFVTEDKEKAQEIFEDKLKFPFSELPTWMQPQVLNDRENFFKLGTKEEKGDRDGVNSSIRVVAPKKTVIAGGAPNKVDIDEMGNIGIASKMIEDQRPTMYMFNKETGKIEIKRQLSAYGTGGELEKGGKAFETEFMSIWNAWLKGDYSSCIVPIFLDWTARPGATQENYENEKRVAYAKEGPEHKETVIRFHQTWPSSLSDVFKTSGKTLVDDDFINVNLERIRKAAVDKSFQLIKSGYFEPVYDFTSPADEHSDLPYKVIGANFVPTSDLDPRGVVTMFAEPLQGWINRYYEGTDPIMSDSGVSEMASAIWDKYHKTISCHVSFRTNDPREPYLQSMLMGLYYGVEKDRPYTPELVESNIGPPYCQYKIAKGFEPSIVLNYELPSYLQNHSTKNDGMGIDNKNPRASVIINKLHELIHGYGERIYMERFFTQLKTFVCTVTAGGTETWAPTNKRYFRDDLLYAYVYAYICGEYCYPERIPANLSSEKSKTHIVYENYYDETPAGPVLRRRAVRKKVMQ